MENRAHDPLTPIPDRARKGRGAVGNPTGRFERLTRHAVADGWERAANPDERDDKPGGAADGAPDRPMDGAPMDGGPMDGPVDGGPMDEGDGFDDAFRPPPLRTTVGVDSARRVITRNQSPDLGFDRSINPYRGCEHGCVYCFARPTHAYLGLSPGLDFESRLFAKPDAAALLRAELARPAYRRRPIRPIAMGTNTDPYQPVEREHRITRQILEVLAEHEHPVSIVSKSALIVRDIDILAAMAEKGLASAAISITTLDRGLARRLEPRAATPARRLETIAALSRAGIPTAVMVAPVIPALTDHEMEAIIEAAAKAGAEAAGWILLRLPLEIKDLFADWLAEHAPYRANHVLSLLRGARGGRLNDPNFGSRLVGTGEYAKLIGQRFEKARARAGLAGQTPKLDVSRFHVPADAAETAQLRLL
jgi:DNA repair photolyase